MSKTRPPDRPFCSVCEEEFENMGVFLSHFQEGHDKPPWQEEVVLRDLYYEKQLPAAKVADELGCHQTTVFKWMRKLDLERRSGGRTKDQRLGEYGSTDEQKAKLNDKAWMVEQYVEREKSLSQIAEDVGCSRTPVRNAVENFDLEIRDRGWSGYHKSGEETTDYPELYDADWLEEEYIEKNRTLSDIAAELGCTITPVSFAVGRYDLRKDFSEAYRGEDHGAYEGGPSYYGADWTEKRQEALERDGHKCVACGMSNETHIENNERQLHVHHIKPIRSFEDPKSANRLSNLVTYCEKCHRRWEGIPVAPESS